MRFLILLCVVALTKTAPQAKYQYDLADAGKLFNDFLKQYGRQYSSQYERNSRFENFKKFLEESNRLNKLDPHAVYGINKFSDLSHDEFLSKYATLKVNTSEKIRPISEHRCRKTDMLITNLPDSHDWRDKNVVTPVREQGDCGSCWAFSASDCVESAYAKKTGKLIVLSKQQLVDCDEKSKGCDGGFMTNALEAYMKMGGAVAESDYIYEEKSGECRFEGKKVQVNVTGCLNYDIKDEDKLRGIMYEEGPVSIALDATLLHFYKKGIMTVCTGRKLNHALLLVGYGTEKDIPYWIIKNSWGEGFGEKGYFKLKRNINACGIQNGYAVTAEVE